MGKRKTALQKHLSAAGRKGGQATAAKHGPDFYSEIGKKGGSKPKKISPD